MNRVQRVLAGRTLHFAGAPRTRHPRGGPADSAAQLEESAMPATPLFVYADPALRLGIWPTHVDVEQAGTVTRLPMRTITCVERAMQRDQLLLFTVDGQTYTYALPPEQIEAAQGALVQALDQRPAGRTRIRLG
jgi:hypothetical protein